MISNTQVLSLPNRLEHLKLLIGNNKEYKFSWTPKAHYEVNNCLDASKARKIKLHQEMKSIFLKLRSGFYLFHLRGDESISEKKINKLHRKYSGNKTKIRFASNTELSTFNVEKGKVNPLLEELWTLPHFISPTLLLENHVFTNDGTLDGYINFNPSLILETNKCIVDEFIV